MATLPGRNSDDCLHASAVVQCLCMFASPLLYVMPSCCPSTLYAAVLNLASLACGCLQSFAKRLYRFMRRAMTRWPEQQPIGPLINLYLAYVAPWSVSCLILPCQILLQMISRRAWGSASSLPCLCCFLRSPQPQLGLLCHRSRYTMQHGLQARAHLCWAVGVGRTN